jgi:hypothetical protein
MGKVKVRLWWVPTKMPLDFVKKVFYNEETVSQI